jgi:flagellar basal-body rod protein FlgC
MVVDAIFQASRFGLQFERLRLEAASHNIAVSDRANTPGSVPPLLRAVAGHGASVHGILNGSALEGTPNLVAMGTSERDVHDPSDPMANQQGMVGYPRVDLVEEMSTLMEASRAYEANVRAFNTLRSMELRALDMGGGA